MLNISYFFSLFFQSRKNSVEKKIYSERCEVSACCVMWLLVVVELEPYIKTNIHLFLNIFSQDIFPQFSNIWYKISNC